MKPPLELDLARLRAAYEKVRDELLAERTPDGHWVGELSSSALSTATAISALAVVRSLGSEVRGQRSEVSRWDSEFSVLSTQYSPASSVDLNSFINRGVAWLVKQQNADGGFGDTDLSHSNIATTYLVIAALHLAGVADEHTALIECANRYIDSQGRLVGLRRRYGIDKTFVVPIMTNLALAGLVDWREIDPLPFELACVPQSWYRFVGMPMVSYAIPALVAIGQARFFHAPPRNPITRLTRHLSVNRSLKVLRQMQPRSGGYLEATPLTSFVVMSLASTLTRSVSEGPAPARSASQGSGFRVQGSARTNANEILREGVKFLVTSIRADGSWPIDTNLATWNTTLAINALADAGEDVAALLGPNCLDWLLSCQHLQRHPFTGANPGGFGWSDLSGAVPDADDTAGALLAMNSYIGKEAFPDTTLLPAQTQAIWWLLQMQNRDGGWPTFCRGWGRLPFDRSGTDLTAHVLRACHIWTSINDKVERITSAGLSRKQLGPRGTDIPSTIERQALGYLAKYQRPDGSWAALWFGNQDHPAEENPVYGTAKVLFAYRDLGLIDSPEAQRGIAWLLANQNPDGGWGSGPWKKLHISNLQFAMTNLQSSIEETALATEALLTALPLNPEPRTLNPDTRPPTPEPRNATEGVPYSVARGLSWLLDRIEQNQHRQPAPIGFYFAKLWYYEKLYPLTFTVAALGRACRQIACLARPDLQP